MAITTLYVDVENLTDIAKRVIISAIEQWPPEFFKPDVIRLYVKAEQTQLWQIWVGHKFPSIKSEVIGIQRYNYSQVSKNLADMTLVLDVITDLLKNRTTHVAILGDDSDYVVLFSLIKKEIPQDENGKLPFIWFLTDRADTHSQSLNDFLPLSYLRTIICKESKDMVSTSKRKNEGSSSISAQTVLRKNADVHSKSIDEPIAKSIIKEIPVGFFKSTDCRKIVQRIYPKHALSKMDNPTFGTQFAKNVWPILETYGVKLPNPEKKPRKYEMTEEAKRKLTD